ncbi:hypothetical protein HPB49_023055 [Dermacentor silvarum]|uniref:Uncharacterized protein n=1 Tax=Dermacentor silvarum TaxID=543639 RepID=A0ACB8CN86_DERSI|nr:hypothetical protein HPB49_023055 [Dermacentor silvarum]
MVRRALAATQEAFQAGLLITYVACVARLCTAVYYAITVQFHALSSYSYVLYIFYVVTHFTILSKGTDSLVGQVNKLKRTLSSSEYDRTLQSSEKKALQAFLLSLDPERYRLSVAGLFELRLSSLAKPQGCIITGEYYASLLEQLKEAVKTKRRTKLTEGMLLLPDNAPSHTSKVLTAKLKTLGFQLVHHPLQLN